MQFVMSDKERMDSDAWLAEVALPAALNYQKKTYPKPKAEMLEYWDMNQPYGVSTYYEFSNSSGIGQSVKVMVKVQGFSIKANFTDYDRFS